MTTQRCPDDLSPNNTEIGRRFTELCWSGRMPDVLSLLSRRLTPTEERCCSTVWVRVRRQRGTEVFHFLVPSARPLLVGSQAGRTRPDGIVPNGHRRLEELSSMLDERSLIMMLVAGIELRSW